MSAKLRVDAFVKDLVDDPSKIPDIQILIGFVGKGSSDNVWRIYSTLELDEFVEINDRDVLRQEQVGVNQSDIGGSILWVRRGLDVRVTRTARKEAETNFLRGRIANMLGDQNARQVFDLTGTGGGVANPTVTTTTATTFGCGVVVGTIITVSLAFCTNALCAGPRPGELISPPT